MIALSLAMLLPSWKDRRWRKGTHSLLTSYPTAPRENDSDTFIAENINYRAQKNQRPKDSINTNYEKRARHLARIVYRADLPRLCQIKLHRNYTDVIGTALKCYLDPNIPFSDKRRYTVRLSDGKIIRVTENQIRWELKK